MKQRDLLRIDRAHRGAPGIELGLPSFSDFLKSKQLSSSGPRMGPDG